MMKKMEHLTIMKNKIGSIVIEKFLKFINFFSALILFLIGGSAFIMTSYYAAKYNETSDLVIYQFDNVLINILVIVALIFLIFLFLKVICRVNNKTLIIIICITQFVLGILWVLYMKLPPQADQECLTYAAAQFIKGDFSWMDKGGYLAKYPFQLGMVFLIEILFRIFNTTNFLLPQLLNVFALVASTYLIYKITEYLFEDKKITKILLILTSGFLYLILMTTHVYGNLIGLALALSAIFFTIKYIKTEKFCNLILLTFFISASMIFKNNYMIFLVGIVLALLLNLIKKFKWSTLIGIGCVVVISLMSGKLIIKIGEIRSGYSTENSSVPMISYVFMGINKNHENPGWYTADTIKILERNNYDTKKASKESSILLRNRITEMISEPKESTLYIGKKILSTWTEPTYEMIKINKPKAKFSEIEDRVQNNKLLLSFYDGSISKILIKYFDALQIIIYLSTAFYLFYNRKNLNIEKIILPLIFLGGFVFHLMWETKAIYVLPFYFILLPYTAACLKIFFDYINKIFLKK